MTADDFRRVALGLPEAIEQSHMGNPDFRVRGRIFATLPETGDFAVLKLTPTQQEMVQEAEPGLFEPVNGGWGRKGWTRLRLKEADEAAARSGLGMAWRNVAPKRLAASVEGLV